MQTRRLLLGFALAAMLAVAGWFGWRWYTTPAPPELPLERMDRAVAEVIDSALQEVRRDPRSGEAWGKLAVVTSVNGYTVQAADCLIQAERFDPANPRWPYLRGFTGTFTDPQKVFPLFRQALERATVPDERAAILFRLALGLIEDGQLAEADSYLQELRTIEPDSLRVHFGLGHYAVVRDDRPAARQHLVLIVGSPFGRKRANAHLAAIALADGDEDLARFHQGQAAKLPADLPWPDPLLDAMNRYAVGRQSRFLEAESLEGRGRLREALVLLRQIAETTPDARSFLALGLALAKLNELDEAEQVLRSVIRLEAQNMQAHHFLGSVLFFKAEKLVREPGGKDRALELFRQAAQAADQAVALQPDNAMAHVTRGRALKYLGRTKESVEALREAVLCRPEFTDTHLYLGEALAEAGQFPEAIVHLENAVRFAAPGDTRAREALDAWRPKSKRSP